MTKIIRLNLAMRQPEDVIPHLGKPIHWKEGRSAKSLADSWFSANDIPREVRAVLDQAPEYRKATLVDAFLERCTSLEDGRPTASQTDLLAILGMGEDEEYDELYLSQFIAAGPGSASMALVVRQEYLTPAQWRKFAKQNSNYIAEVEKYGFSYDGAEGEIYFPVLLDKQVLSAAFKDDDFELALAPLGKAIADTRLGVVPTAHDEAGPVWPVWACMIPPPSHSCEQLIHRKSASRSWKAHEGGTAAAVTFAEF